MNVDVSAWSGDGNLTRQILDVLQQQSEIAAIRVEDAPASRAGAWYNLLANGVYVVFATAPDTRRWRRFLAFRRAPVVRVPRLSLSGLEGRLAAMQGIGPADYADEEMLQYLRTERITPPHQTVGYKLVELVRIHEAASGQPSGGGSDRQRQAPTLLRALRPTASAPDPSA
jgi:hypothetical protein